MDPATQTTPVKRSITDKDDEATASRAELAEPASSPADGIAAPADGIAAKPKSSDPSIAEDLARPHESTSPPEVNHAINQAAVENGVSEGPEAAPASPPADEDSNETDTDPKDKGSLAPLSDGSLSPLSDAQFTPIEKPPPPADHEENLQNDETHETEGDADLSKTLPTENSTDAPSKTPLTENNNTTIPTIPQHTQKDSVDGLPGSIGEFATQVSLTSTPKHTKSQSRQETEPEIPFGQEAQNKMVYLMKKVEQSAKMSRTRALYDLNLDQSIHSTEDRASLLGTGAADEENPEKRQHLNPNDNQDFEEDHPNKDKETVHSEDGGGNFNESGAVEVEAEDEVQDSMGEDGLEKQQASLDDTLDFEDEEAEESMEDSPTTPLDLHPRSTLKTLKRVSDAADLEAQKKEIDQIRSRVRDLVKNDIFDRACVLEAEKNFLVSLNCQKSPSKEERREQTARNAILSTAIKEANEKMKESLAKERKAKEGQLKEQQKETASHMKEVCRNVRESLDMIAIEERLIMIPINRIDHWERAREKDPRAIVKIQYEVMRGMQKQRDMIVHVARKGNRFTLVDGVQRKCAYEELYELVKESFPDDFEHYIEDEEDVFLHTPSASQPVQGSSPCKIPRRSDSQSPTTTPPQKQMNPFAMIPALIIESAPKALNLDFCVEYRANQAPKGRKLEPIQRIAVLRRMATGLYLSDPRALTQKKQEEELKKSAVACSRASVRAIRFLPEECDSNLDQIAKEFPELNTKAFINSYIAARKVCQQTADQVIRDILKGGCTPEEGVTQLAEHSSRVSYLLMGIHVAKEVALFVERRLQFGKRSYGRVRFYIRDKNRLDSVSIMKKRHDPMLILQELERDLDNCIAFVKPTVYYRRVNNGTGSRQCLVNFIDYKDLTERKMEEFRAILAMGKTSKFIVTQGKESTINIVDELFKNHNIHSSEFFFEALAVDDNGKAKLEEHNTIRAALIEASRGSTVTSGNLRENLKKYRIDNTITNQHLRHLIYDSERTTVLDENKYNTAFVHSFTTEILCILANLALNRIYTSLDDDDSHDFATKLTHLQKAKTSGPDVIQMKLKKEKVAPKRPADDP